MLCMCLVFFSVPVEFIQLKLAWPEINIYILANLFKIEVKMKTAYIFKMAYDFVAMFYIFPSEKMMILHI